MTTVTSLLDIECLGDILDRLIASPLAAAALAATCKWMQANVKVSFCSVDGVRYWCTGKLSSGHYTCGPSDYVDVSRYNGDVDDLEYIDMFTSEAYCEDDYDEEGNEPDGCHDFWFECAPTYIASINYRRCEGWLIGVHSAAVKYIDDDIYEFQEIVYVSDPFSLGQADEKGNKLFRLSHNYYAVYKAYKVYKYVPPAPTTTAPQ